MVSALRPRWGLLSGDRGYHLQQTSTDTQPSAPQVEAKITAALERLAVTMQRALWDAAHAHKLSATQAQFLIYLGSMGASAVTLSDLAAHFGLSLPTVSEAVRSLRAKGLLEVRRGREDGRTRQLRLTAQGRRRLVRLQRWSDAIRAQVATLTPQAKGELLSSLLELIARLQQAGLISLTRQCHTCLYFQPHRYADPAAPHHCGLLDQPLHLTELRLHCPDHQPRPQPPPPLTLG